MRTGQLSLTVALLLSLIGISILAFSWIPIHEALQGAFLPAMGNATENADTLDIINTVDTVIDVFPLIILISFGFLIVVTAVQRGQGEQRVAF